VSYPITGSNRMGSIRQAVLAAVRAIPAGRVMSYGDVAEFVGNRSARMVGRVLATYEPAVDEPDLPWHRVVRADGTCAEHLCAEQIQRLRTEGVRVDGSRVHMTSARWDGRSD
jgi:methylated-DNA-protein-cysteine methyltransferase related protein